MLSNGKERMTYRKVKLWDKKRENVWEFGRKTIGKHFSARWAKGK